jgi:D-3-phosphoglycerate dehydrogenase
MTFRLGLTRDARDAAGNPNFGVAALKALDRNPNLSWEWLPEQVKEITPDIAARYDGLYLLSARMPASAVARDDRRVKIVARHGVGFDSVDVAAMTAKGIVVTNTPIAIRRPVAVAALTMLFALGGRLFDKDRITRANDWPARNDLMGVGFATRTLGVVGAGGIGAELIPLARPFFARVVAADPFVDADRMSGLGAEKADLDQLMAMADFIVIACPLNDDTLKLINARRLALMKPSAFLVNVARGPIVDEAALIETLRAGRIAGAGLDVFEREPTEPDNPLLSMENVIVTPHALCWTDECFHEIAVSGLGAVVDVSLGLRPPHVVNPEVYAAGKP